MSLVLRCSFNDLLFCILIGEFGLDLCQLIILKKMLRLFFGEGFLEDADIVNFHFLFFLRGTNLTATSFNFKL